MNYDAFWYYEHPRNAYQDWHNRYYEYRRTGGPRPSALSMSDSNQWKYHVSGLPILGDFMRADDYTTYMNKYLKARDMTWADVKYPSLARGAGSSARAVGSMVDTAISATFLRAMRNMYR